MKAIKVTCVSGGTSRDAVYIDPSTIEDARDPGSLLYRSTLDPAYTIKNGEIQLAGEGTVNYADVVGDFTIVDGSGTADPFPESLYRSLVLYVAIKLLQRKAQELLEVDEDIELGNAMNSHAAFLQKEFSETLAPYGVSI